MKHGKNPTNKQKAIIQNAGLNPANWLVSKDTTEKIMIINRKTNRDRTIIK